MLPEFIRRRMSEGTRETISTALLSQMAKHKWSYWLYSQIIDNGYPAGAELLPNWELGYNYKGHLVRVPRESGSIIKESLQQNLYGGYPIEEDNIVLDLGAYVGTFTLRALIETGKRGMVIAVEPNPRNMGYCMSNCRKFSNVKYVNKAISNRIGKANLYLSKASAGHTLIYPHKNSMEVETTTIDELVEELKLPRVDLIKMDIEGANLMALEGAEKTLKRPEVKLAIAAYHKLPNGKPELPSVIAFLKDRGFEIHEEGHSILLPGCVYAKKQKRG